MKEDLIFELYKKHQSVFSLKELSLLFPQFSYKNIKRRLSYYVKSGKLKRLRQGIYAKEQFNYLELANKIYSPSYIGLETVLEREGIIFQKYKVIFVVSYLTRKVALDEQKIFYRKIKVGVLLNNIGIQKENYYSIATKERAFLDAVFLYKDYHFDNLKPLDWDKVMEIKKIYQSKILEERVEEYRQTFKKEYAG